MAHTTIEQAQQELREVEMDVEADQGREAVEAAWTDLVRHVAADCTPEVAAELLRREGLELR
jgi:hypothetical protein